MICYWFEEPIYFFFTSDLPELLYYSHISTSIIALLVGLFVFLNARDKLLNRLLLIIAVCFSLWTFVNLILWTNIHSEFLLFSWSFLRVLSSFMSIFCIYFIYVFLEKKDISLKIKWIFFLLLAPVLIFAPTNLNVGGFDISNCDAFMFEGALFKFYHLAFGVLAMIWIFFLLVKKYVTAEPDFKKQILYMGIGIEAFLFSFFTVIFLAVYLTGVGILPDSRLEMYGLFGMVVFMVFMGILIVRFKTFNVGMIASQALVIALVALTASQFTFVTSATNMVLTAITLFLTTVIGFVLIRSVKNEVRQRKQIEKLATDLQKANTRLKILDKMKSEFVSIASHQLRSPLTAIRGYASMLLEGSYGKFGTKAKEAIERIADSSRFMALSVEDYLNVSRIEAGNMKYEIADFNLKDVADKIVDELRPTALKKGLLMVFRSDCNSGCTVHADIGKTRQVIMNVIDNSMKYTPEGTITVLAHDDLKKKKMYISIKDTGVGMSKETAEEVFDKFIRAKNANEINVTGTGLGLFVAKKMILEMKGNIWAESKGEGKGSTFHIELPLISKK